MNPPSLRKLDTDSFLSVGVSEYTVDLATQEVVVKGTIEYEDVLGRIKKTGKEASRGCYHLIAMLITVRRCDPALPLNETSGPVV